MAIFVSGSLDPFDGHLHWRENILSPALPLMAFESGKSAVQPAIVQGLPLRAAALGMGTAHALNSDSPCSGFDEVILLNEHGEVAECTAANIFCVHGNVVSTPPSQSGCLLGVTREILLEIAPQVEISILEHRVTLQELFRADEIFITSTTRSIEAVRRIEDHNVREGLRTITT